MGRDMGHKRRIARCYANRAMPPIVVFGRDSTDEQLVVLMLVLQRLACAPPLAAQVQLGHSSCMTNATIGERTASRRTGPGFGYVIMHVLLASGLFGVLAFSTAAVAQEQAAGPGEDGNPTIVVQGQVQEPRMRASSRNWPYA